MGFNLTADESFQMGMNSRERKLDETERRLAVVEKKLASDVRENVHGEWIFIPIDDSRGRRTGDMRCVCKKCNYEIVLPFSKAPYNYCPYCGADMRKGETNG